MKYSLSIEKSLGLWIDRNRNEFVLRLKPQPVCCMRAYLVPEIAYTYDSREQPTLCLPITPPEKSRPTFFKQSIAGFNKGVKLFLEAAG